MAIAELKDWGTFIGALVAAATGVITVWRQWRSGGDRIYVGWGPLSGSISPGVDLYVQNLSAHRVHVLDYGLVLHSGELHSFPFEVENAVAPDDFSGYLMKETTLEPRATAEAGQEINGSVAGVWARTTTQRYPRLRLNGSTLSLVARLVLRVKIYWRAWQLA